MSCVHIGSDSDGNYPEMAINWDVCTKNESYSNLKSFPFKKEMPCFQLDFWHSEFVELIDGTEESEERAFALYREKYVSPSRKVPEK